MASDAFAWQSAAFTALVVLVAGAGVYVYLAVRKNAPPFRLLHLSPAQPGATVSILINSRPRGRYLAGILLRNAGRPLTEAESQSLLTADVEAYDDEQGRLSHSHMPQSALHDEMKASRLKPAASLSISGGFKPLESARDIGQGAGRPAYGFLIHAFNVPGDLKSGTIWLKIRLTDMNREMEDRHGPFYLLVEETAG